MAPAASLNTSDPEPAAAIQAEAQATALAAVEQDVAQRMHALCRHFPAPA